MDHGIGDGRHVGGVEHGLLGVHVLGGHGDGSHLRGLHLHWLLGTVLGDHGGVSGDILLELTLCAVTPARFYFSSFDVEFFEDDDDGCGNKMRGHSIVRNIEKERTR